MSYFLELEEKMKNHPDKKVRIEAGLQYVKECKKGIGGALIHIIDDLSMPAKIRNAAKKALDEVGRRWINYLTGTTGFPEKVLEISRNPNLSNRVRAYAGMAVIHKLPSSGTSEYGIYKLLVDMATDSSLPISVRQEAGEEVLQYCLKLRQKEQYLSYKDEMIYDFAVRLMTNPHVPVRFRKKAIDAFLKELKKMVEHFAKENSYYNLSAMAVCRDLPDDVNKAAEKELDSAAQGLIVSLEFEGNVKELSFFSVYPHVPEKTRNMAREKAEQMVEDMVETHGFIVDSDMFSKYKETLRKKRSGRIKKATGKRKARQ